MSERPPIYRYGVVPLAVALAMLVRWPVLGTELPYLLMWPVVLVCAWWGRLGPGLLATALSALSVAYFLLEPHHSLAVARPADLAGLAAFLVLGAAISVLIEGVHRGRERAGRQAEEVARQREWLRVSLTSIGDAVIATDREGRVTFVNPAAEALTGWGQREAQGRLLEEVFPIINEGTRQPVEPPVARVIREGVVVGLANHTVLVAKDGTERPIEDSAAPIKDDAGRVVGVILVFHDVSEKRRQEKALEGRTADLAVAMAHLEAVFDSVDEGIVAFDRDANIVFCNEAEARIVGFASPQEMLRNLSYFAEVFELSDADGRIVPVEGWPVSRVLRGEAFTDWQCHGRRKDTGQEWDFSFGGSPVRDAEGRQVLSVIVTRDITARKAAERALRESEERFRAVFDQTAVGVALVGLDGTTLWFNRGLCHMLGYSEEEFRGKTFRDVTHPDDLRAELSLAGRVAAGEVQTARYEKRYVRKDGSTLWGDLSLSTVCDGAGRPKYLAGVVMDVTARRQAEAAFRQSESRKAAVLDAALDGIITIDREGKVIEFNPAAEAVFGYRREDVLGRDMADFIIPPPLREAHRQGMARYLATGEGPVLNTRLELTAVRAGGAEFPVELAITPIPGGDGHPVFTGFVRDITARKASEQALRDSEQRFRTLADTIPQLAWTARPDGHIDWYNRRWYEYTGTTPEQMEGWGWQSVHDPQELPKVLDRWRASLATGEPFDMVFPLKGKDGVFRPFLTRVAPLRADDGRILQWFGTNTDVSEIKEMEERLRDADRRKDQFVMMLAHELRNPLAPIRTGLQLLQASQRDGQVVEQARAMMARQVGHMARIIEDLLDVSRLLRGRVELRPERLDLGRLTRTALEDHRAAFDRAGVSLAADLPELPAWVEGDPTRLTQVIDNLLQNAAKFTERGGSVAVRVRADPDTRQAVLAVRDTGVGIEPGLLPHLFETFTQADRSLDRSKGGLGLGLSLVKGLVELHGGTVHAASEGPGRGAEFVVRLPSQPEPAAITRMPDAPQRSGSKLRILVVEDNRDAADSLKMLLQLFGYEVNVAYCGPSGVEAARGWNPDVILCDIGLPGLSGYEVAKALRQDPATAKARMIAVTGYGGDEDRLKTRDAGFDAHLTKPADPAALQELLAAGAGAA